MGSEFDDLDNAALWQKWIESPEGKAREKVNEALTDLMLDPEIIASPICVEFLKLMLKISPADVEADTVFDLVEPLAGYFHKLQALKGVAAKLAADPKQREKAAVYECWKLWQKDPSRYNGKASFSRDMLEKFGTLKSQPVIER